MTGKTSTKKRGLPSKEACEDAIPAVKRSVTIRPIEDVRFDNIGHIPDMFDKKG